MKKGSEKTTTKLELRTRHRKRKVRGQRQLFKYTLTHCVGALFCNWSKLKLLCAVISKD